MRLSREATLTMESIANTSIARGWSRSDSRRRARRAALVGTVAVMLAALVGVAEATALQFVGRVPSSGGSGGVSRLMPVYPEGTVDVGGVVDCPAGTPVQIHFRLTQPSTGAVAEGDWFGTCTGAGPSPAHRSQTWTVTGVSSMSGVPFAPSQGRGGAEFTGHLVAGEISETWSQAPINLMAEEN